MAPSIITEVDMLREATGVPLIPTLEPAGHVRWEASASRHSLKEGKRLSDATDLFVGGGLGAWLRVWTVAQDLGFGGIGVYFDTYYKGKPRVMFHFDMRAPRMLWVRRSKRYVYLRRPLEARAFFSILSEETLR